MMEQAALTRAMGLVWDQGNAAGLDGWIGPGRGSGEVDEEAIRLRQRDVNHYLKTLPGRTEQEIRADQRAEDLALHLAFRPEVVAEVAVPLSDESDWEKIAAWCGGTIGSSEAGDSGEWDSWIAIPGADQVATSRSWIVKRHDGTFDVRLEVEEPSEKSLAQIKAEAWDEGRQWLAEQMGDVTTDKDENPYRADELENT